MISGSIQITLTEPKWYHYVAVCLHGKGKVRWTGSHYEDETYADLSVAVWGNKEAPQPTKIDSGTFDFLFELAIPAQCPPTFNTFTGDIEYKQILI